MTALEKSCHGDRDLISELNGRSHLKKVIENVRGELRGRPGCGMKGYYKTPQNDAWHARLASLFDYVIFPSER
jgi:hypothetical protein